MPKGHKPPSPPNKMPTQPTDCREAVQWFVNTVGLYISSSRGLFLTDFGEDQQAILDSAVIDLKSRGIVPLVLDSETIAAQAQHLWSQAIHHTKFGRPLASQFELEVSGTDVLILKNFEAPETAHHLWYLFHHIFFPRALSQKPILMTTPLGLEEFEKSGETCEDIEFAGRHVTWLKLLWLIESTCVDSADFRLSKEQGLPPMLKSERLFLEALKERTLPVQAQYVIGDYMLDLALIDKDRKIDIECDVLSTLDAGWEAKKNLLLLSDSWKVLKFGAGELASNMAACVDVAEEVWTQGRKRSTFGRLLSGHSATSIPELPADDEVQRLAITHGAGPCATEGGAGTGKSSCVSYRVAYLLSQGINPDRILVVSHSQETVRALKSAVELIADRQSVQRVMFHSWHDLGLKILKENLGAIKRKPPLKIEANPQKVIQRVLTKYRKDLDPVTLELSEELDEFTIASLISLYKANLVTAKHLKDRGKTDVDELVAKVFQGYEDQLQKINRIDRDDMVSLAAQTLVDRPDIALKYQQQYDFVLVDEYQDATAAGDLMVRAIAAPQDNLYLSGDEDEAIYESKGGLPRLMADMSIRMPNARCYVLEKNWRCHPAIVDHSRQLIANLARRRIAKDMVSGWGPSQTGAIVGPQIAETEQAEAEWVAQEISALIAGGRDPNDIAVLYRYHRYGIIIEEALSGRGIRCVTSHPEAGLIPDEVGDVMAFLRLVMDPDGPKARESFERVCQLRVKEIDAKLFATIAGFAEANNLSYLKAVEIYSEAVPDPSCQDLRKLVNILRTMHQQNMAPADTIARLKRTQGLGDYYKSVKVPPGVNYEPLRKLAQLEEDARNFSTVSEFVKAQTAAPKQVQSSKDVDDHVVHILTLHEAKGKEFGIVYLVGLAEGLFPADSVPDREEERRLCYVGMTRARDLLYVSYPAVFNNIGLQASSFLVEARLMTAMPPPMVFATPTQPLVPAVEVALPPVTAAAAPIATPIPATPVPMTPVPATVVAPVVTAPVPVAVATTTPAAAPIPATQRPPEAIPAPAQAPIIAPPPSAPTPTVASTLALPVQAPLAASLMATSSTEVVADLSIGMAPEPVKVRPEKGAPFPSKGQGITRRVPRQLESDIRSVAPETIPLEIDVPAARPALEAAVPIAAAPPSALAAPDAAPTPPFAPKAVPEVPIPSVQGEPPGEMDRRYKNHILNQHGSQLQEIFDHEVVAAQAAATSAPEPAMGPVQSALQRRNSKKQPAKAENNEQTNLVNAIANAAAQNVSGTAPPTPRVAAEGANSPSGATENAAPGAPKDLQQEGPADQYNAVAYADLSILHDKALPQQNQVRYGLPISRKKSRLSDAERIALENIEAASTSTQSDNLNVADTVQSVFGDLGEDVPPGVTIHTPTGLPLGAMPPSKGFSKASKNSILDSWNAAEPEPIPEANTGVEAVRASSVRMPVGLPGAETFNPSLPWSEEPVGEADIDDESLGWGDTPLADSTPASRLHAQFGQSPASEPPVPGRKGSRSKTDPVAGDAMPAVSREQDAAETNEDGMGPLASKTDRTSEVHESPSLPAPQTVPLPENTLEADVPSHSVAEPAAPTEVVVEHKKHPVEQTPGIFTMQDEPEPFQKPKLEQFESAVSDVDDLLAGLDLGPEEQAPSARPLRRPSWADAADSAFPGGATTPLHSIPAVSRAEHKMPCSGCGAALEGGARFCGECGTLQAQRIPACHLCGAPLEPSAKFCGECGSPRGDTTSGVHVHDEAVPNVDSQEYKSFVASQEKPTQKNWVVKLLKFLEQ